MAKTPQKKKFPVLPVVLVTGIALAAGLLFLMPRLLYQMSDPQGPIAETTLPAVSDQSEAVTDPVQTEPAVQIPQEDLLVFPLTADGANLRIETPFSYDGIIPGAEMEEAKNVAVITIQNMTGKHLVRAAFTLTLGNGDQIRFLAEHIPSGKRAMLFAEDNAKLPKNAQWVDAECTAEYAESVSIGGGKLDIRTEGTLVRVTNESSSPIDRIVIYCHNSLGEEYWGGIAYPYEVNNIPAGETVEIDALDCILGMAEVSFIDGIHE